MKIKMEIYNNDNLAKELEEFETISNEVSVDNEVIHKERSNYVRRKNGVEVRKAREVEPIRSQKDLKNFLDLFAQGLSSQIPALNARNYAIFMLGITTGLRVSDLMKLKVRDVITLSKRDNKVFDFRDKLEIVEQKTGKTNYIPKISDKCKKALYDYFQELEKENVFLEFNDYLWVTANNTNGIKIKSKPLCEENYYCVLKKLHDSMEWEIPTRVGTHTMRKTCAYWLFKNSKDEDKSEVLAVLQEWFNHSSQRITLKYIGITQETKTEVFNKFDSFLDSFM